MQRELLTAAQAAEYTSLAVATLRKMAWERRIRSFKVVGALRFSKEDLEALITERPQQTSQPKKLKRAAIQVDSAADQGDYNETCIRQS